jgi:hypothetical protein
VPSVMYRNKQVITVDIADYPRRATYATNQHWQIQPSSIHLLDARHVTQAVETRFRRPLGQLRKAMDDGMTCWNTKTAISYGICRGKIPGVHDLEVPQHTFLHSLEGIHAKL